MDSEHEPAPQIRTLGLALQLFAAFSLTPLLPSLVQTMLSLPSEMLRDYLRFMLPAVMGVGVQLMAGWALSYRPRSWALPAVIVFAATQVGLVCWLIADLPVGGGQLAALLLRLAWPIVVVAAVLHARTAPADRGRRGAESGGALAAIGLSLLLWWSLVALDLFRNLGTAGAEREAFLAVQLGTNVLVGLLALRAGHRLVTGAAHPGLGAYLAAVVIPAAAILVLRVLYALLSEGEDSLVDQIVIGVVSLATTLLVPLLIWTYARPSRALVQRDAPDGAAAVGALAWFLLGYTLELAAGMIGMVTELKRNMEGLWFALFAVQIAMNLATFVASRRGPARGAMWAAAISGVLALIMLVMLWLKIDPSADSMIGAGWAFAMQAAALFVLAWLHRSSASGERGVEVVFE